MADAVALVLVRIVGVRFKRAGKIYYFDPGELELVRGDRVLVETSAGVEFGEVVVPVKMVPESDVVPPIRPVLREVMREDYDQLLANRQDERVAHKVAEERIAARGLPMRLVNTEYTFDRNRLTFFFTADTRVDFRQLVRDLARQFGVRIELRQIGVRDEAKEFGGIGLCGRELCCSSWLGEFQPVSIRMAKEQRLSLNPSKLTGQCGRLKCCLKYENDTYRQIRAELPAVGDRVQTVVGGETVAGRVIEVLVTRESVEVDVGEGRRVLVSISQIESGEAVVLTGRLARGGETTAVEDERSAVEADSRVDESNRDGLYDRRVDDGAVDEDAYSWDEDDTDYAAGEERIGAVRRAESVKQAGTENYAEAVEHVDNVNHAGAMKHAETVHHHAPAARGTDGEGDAAPAANDVMSLGRAAGADEHAAALELDGEVKAPRKRRRSGGKRPAKTARKSEARHGGKPAAASSEVTAPDGQETKVPEEGGSAPRRRRRRRPRRRPRPEQAGE